MSSKVSRAGHNFGCAPSYFGLPRFSNKHRITLVDHRILIHKKFQLSHQALFMASERFGVYFPSLAIAILNPDKGCAVYPSEFICFLWQHSSESSLERGVVVTTFVITTNPLSKVLRIYFQCTKHKKADYCPKPRAKGSNQ
jgi:hypothetical protein